MTLSYNRNPDYRQPASLLDTWDRYLCLIGTIALLLFTTHAFQFLFAEESANGMVQEDSAQSNPIYRAFVALQFGIFAVLGLWHFAAARVSGRLIFAAFVGAFVVSSILWSIEPGFSLFYATIFLYMIGSAYLISVYFSPSQFLRLYLHLGAVLIAASFIVYAVAPDYALTPIPPEYPTATADFRGVFAGKNSAGLFFASFFLIALMGRALRLPPLYRWLIGGGALAGLVLSNSATALGVAAVLTVVWFLIDKLGVGRSSLYYGVYALLLVLVVAVPFLSLGGEDVSLLGRNATFTGRSELWAEALPAIGERPWLGYGYYGFFSSDPYSPAWPFWERFTYFHTGTLHNSAMDVMASLGVVGLLLMNGICLAAAAVIFNKTIPEEIAALLLLLLTVYTLGSAMEFNIFHHNSVATVVLFYVFFCAGRTYHQPDPEPWARPYRAGYGQPGSPQSVSARWTR